MSFKCANDRKSNIAKGIIWSFPPDGFSKKKNRAKASEYRRKTLGLHAELPELHVKVSIRKEMIRKWSWGFH